MGVDFLYRKRVHFVQIDNHGMEGSWLGGVGRRVCGVSIDAWYTNKEIRKCSENRLNVIRL